MYACREVVRESGRGSSLSQRGRARSSLWSRSHTPGSRGERHSRSACSRCDEKQSRLQLRETTKLDGLYQPASAVDAGVESPVSFPVVVKDGLTRGEKGLPPLKTLALRVALVGHVALVPSLEIAHVHTGLAFGHIAHLRNRPQASEATVSDLHRMGQGATGAFGCLQRSRQTY
jgi:hypothetical protein